MKTIVFRGRSFGIHLILVIAVFIFVFEGAPASAQPPARPDPQGGVRAGEIMQVRIEQDLSTRNVRRGQTFQTSLLQEVRSTNGTMLIPRGSIIYGRVDRVQQPQRRRRPGVIEVSFFSIKFPNGRRVPFSGSLVSPDDEGQVSAGRVTRREVMFVGGTGGALIGAIAGGGTGAAVGGLVGATGGLLTRRFTNGQHAEVGRNTEFGVYVDRRFDLPPYQ
jgi:hypothetical protein